MQRNAWLVCVLLVAAASLAIGTEMCGMNLECNHSPVEEGHCLLFYSWRTFFCNKQTNCDENCEQFIYYYHHNSWEVCYEELCLPAKLSYSSFNEVHAVSRKAIVRVKRSTLVDSPMASEARNSTNDKSNTRNKQPADAVNAAKKVGGEKPDIKSMAETSKDTTNNTTAHNQQSSPANGVVSKANENKEPVKSLPESNSNKEVPQGDPGKLPLKNGPPSNIEQKKPPVAMPDIDSNEDPAIANPKETTGSAFSSSSTSNKISETNGDLTLDEIEEEASDAFVKTNDISSFFPFFLASMVTLAIVYVVYHNKKKILGLVFEGRPSRRPNRRKYRKLDTNLEEAVTSSRSKSPSNVLY